MAVMSNTIEIITVGFSPAWDVTCAGKNLAWGKHPVLDSIDLKPAGKALNVSKALAWLGKPSIACGLWGENDFEMMESHFQHQNKIKIKMTKAAGATRQNITIIDSAQKKDMHLRAKSLLANKASMAKLVKDLSKIVHKNSICVFSGAMPEGKELVKAGEIINMCKKRNAKVAIDSSGSAYKKIVDGGGLFLLKPNVNELCELVGRKIPDNAGSLVDAAKKLLSKAEYVLVSRGSMGAILVTKNKVLLAQAKLKKDAVNTVCCGDFLLAGFLKGILENTSLEKAIETALKTATAKAWGLSEKNWQAVSKKIDVIFAEVK
jgi:1-phosphofructokinase family hexose kinase